MLGIGKLSTVIYIHTYSSFAVKCPCYANAANYRRERII
jgi:hypothetical protein